MVAITAYSVGEYVLYIGLSYAMVCIGISLSMIADIINDRSYWLSVIMGAVIGFFILFIYSLPVRIGTIEFINGLLFMYIVFKLKEVISNWRNAKWD